MNLRFETQINVWVQTRKKRPRNWQAEFLVYFNRPSMTLAALYLWYIWFLPGWSGQKSSVQCQINQFKAIQKSWLQALRACCPIINIYYGWDCCQNYSKYHLTDRYKIWDMFLKELLPEVRCSCTWARVWYFWSQNCKAIETTYILCSNTVGHNFGC